MRVGIVRSDIGSVYLSDVENRAQRCFSSEPAGQSRYFKKPSSEDLLAVLDSKGLIAVEGNVTTATRDTNPGNVLRIRTSSTASYTVITLTSSNTLAVATLVSELNTGFVNAGLKVVASLTSGNAIVLKSTVGGPDALIQVDSVGNGSTANPAIHSGWNSGVTVNGVSVSTLESAIYPSSTTIDVSSSNISGISGFGDLPTADLDALVAAVADTVAPRLVETGPVLLSFTYGILSKLASSSFQPGGERVGLPAGVAAAIVEDDGSTPFTL